MNLQKITIKFYTKLFEKSFKNLVQATKNTYDNNF